MALTTELLSTWTAILPNLRETAFRRASVLVVGCARVDKALKRDPKVTAAVLKAAPAPQTTRRVTRIPEKSDGFKSRATAAYGLGSITAEPNALSLAWDLRTALAHRAQIASYARVLAATKLLLRTDFELHQAAHLAHSFDKTIAKIEAKPPHLRYARTVTPADDDSIQEMAESSVEGVRGTVLIVAAALMEQEIKALMRELVQRDILSAVPTGWHDKILVADALGSFGAITASELDVALKARNDCAHDWIVPDPDASRRHIDLLIPARDSVHDFSIPEDATDLLAHLDIEVIRRSSPQFSRTENRPPLRASSSMFESPRGALNTTASTRRRPSGRPRSAATDDETSFSGVAPTFAAGELQHRSVSVNSSTTFRSAFETAVPAPELLRFRASAQRFDALLCMKARRAFPTPEMFERWSRNPLTAKIHDAGLYGWLTPTADLIAAAGRAATRGCTWRV